MPFKELKKQSKPIVRFSPLAQQFTNVDTIFEELKELVKSGDFTLGKSVSEFEQVFSRTVGTSYAIGVGSGTDALKICLKAAGIVPGDQVLTAANTFYATAGAIAEIGAEPKFIDCNDTFCLDSHQLEANITKRTKAIVPVHLTGEVADMPAIMDVADRYGIPVIEDGCQSLLGERNGKQVGSWGLATAFSMHPLKIINVWGDAGVIVTNDAGIDKKARLLRNHGLKNRDEMEIYGFNSRLDSVQAIVGKWIVQQVETIVEQRAQKAEYYDNGFAHIPQIRVPPRQKSTKHVFLLYMVFAEDRDKLLKHCLKNGIEAKIHYPIPLYLQRALTHLGHKQGDFPVTDRHARQCISFPVDQHLSTAQQDYLIETVASFYKV
ncbi:MAG: transcriptional regulator [Rhodospirillaceae bacterium]|nr:transcriptional regulator [Rhodospirillaceae bacterium]|tara:strand:+ start:374 stop:1507 length:1134 start_codon:yes stop_codon:yes gene_type:complete